METERRKKTYVQVQTLFDAAGRMYPQLIRWRDGRSYTVDRVVDVRPAPAARSGGQGDRYTVRIAGQESYLFFEHNPDPARADVGRWFVEEKGCRP